MQAAGTFEVKMTPMGEAGSIPGRMLLEKQFHGHLEGSSKGEMLATRSNVPGSAGYVAMELVSGLLGGRTGTFVLQHSGTMTRGTPTLRVSVVPDSGTDELTGLVGEMTITVADGKHSYGFEYGFAEERSA